MLQGSVEEIEDDVSPVGPELRQALLDRQGRRPAWMEELEYESDPLHFHNAESGASPTYRGLSSPSELYSAVLSNPPPLSLLSDPKSQASPHSSREGSPLPMLGGGAMSTTATPFRRDGGGMLNRPRSSSRSSMGSGWSDPSSSVDRSSNGGLVVATARRHQLLNPEPASVQFLSELQEKPEVAMSHRVLLENCASQHLHRIVVQVVNECRVDSIWIGVCVCVCLCLCVCVCVCE